MPLSIATNVASMTAQRSFMNTNQALETAYERLSTGKRINSGVDDAAGLAMATRMESKVSGLNQAIRNANDGISMVQIAEGALSEATSILQRMRDLAVQAANGALSSTELTYLDNEQEKLAAALDDVLGAAKFNGTALIHATTNTANTLQIGADSTDTLVVTIDGASASDLTVDATSINLTSASQVDAVQQVVEFGIELGLADDDDAFDLVYGTTTIQAAAHTGGFADIDEVVTKLQADSDYATSGFTVAKGAGSIVVTFTAGAITDSLSFATVGSSNAANIDTTGTVLTTGANTVGGAANAINAIDTALDVIANDRASLGASQSQLESTVRNLANVAENTSAAVGRIVDTDYAAETANLTKAQILQQAATSVLAQANAQPQAVLALLQ